MAVTTSLPEPFTQGLRELAALPDAAFTEFLTALKALPVEIRQHLVFPDIPSPDLIKDGSSIKDAVFALLLSRAQRRVPISALIDSVVQSVRLDPPLTERLKERARDILQVESLDLIARAHNVLLEHSRTYSSARIVSDIRTVFGNDVTEQPDAAVVVHMMNMIYYKGGRRETFVVALDEKDIDLLIGVLERAKAKSKTLQQTITNSGVLYIPVL
jgi:hypothetical protein